MNQTKRVMFFLGLSALGAVFLITVIFQAPELPPAVPSEEKIVVAGLFVFLCILGALLALRPNWLKTRFLTEDKNKKNNINEGKRGFRGHHPDCSVFDHHRIIWGKKTWCAGCLGLLGGCIISLIIMIFYVLAPLKLSILGTRLLFFLGLLFIMIQYAENVFPRRHAGVHVILNVLSILGFFLVTISVLELSGDIVYGFYAILLCGLWLETRIHLSQWRHSRLCHRCSQSCKVYATGIIFGR
ncbi:MAG: hypothetical protein BV458_09250 [Thermoplasmata archaeon M9B2D]|nr:MAG: hypothetical protein BV458_09250 [Thermoplasmata archaeon M9B2D]